MAELRYNPVMRDWLMVAATGRHGRKCRRIGARFARGAAMCRMKAMMSSDMPTISPHFPKPRPNQMMWRAGCL